MTTDKKPPSARIAEFLVDELGADVGEKKFPLSVVMQGPSWATLIEVLLGATASGWQPIETAPKDGTAIDLWVSEGGAQFRVIGARWMLGQWQCVARGSGQELWVSASAPTHWMPLPEPPK